MQSPHKAQLSRLAAVPILLLTSLNGCGPGDVSEEDAANLASEFEAGANNATDHTQAQVLRERAESLRAVSEGNEAEDREVKVIGE